MELAARTDESAEDMTAADTAPSPMNATAVGVKYWNTIGRVKRESPMVVPLFVSKYKGTPAIIQSKTANQGKQLTISDIASDG